MEVISRHLDIDLDSLEVKLERTTDETGRVVSAVVANIPINKSAKKRQLYLWMAERNDQRMNIALIAHDKKKELMVQFCIAYKMCIRDSG